MKQNRHGYQFIILGALLAMMLATCSFAASVLNANQTQARQALPHAEATTQPILTLSGQARHFTQFRVGNRNVKSIFADGKYVWVGTSGGLIRYDTNTDRYRLYDVKSGLLSNGIFHISKLGRQILVGTYGGGMSLYQSGSDTWKTYNLPDGLADAFVYDALTMPNGDVWVATWSGANRILGGDLQDRSKWRVYTVENTHGGLPNDWVYGLAQGKHGEVWMATEGGLARFKDGHWRHWTHADGLGADFDKVKKNIEYDDDPGKLSSHHAHQKIEQGLQKIQVAYNPNYIVALAVDKQGTVWCGTWGGGLSSFDGKSWRNYTTADGLPGNHVFMLHVDQKGRLWIGANDGLAKLEGNKFKILDMTDGLYANTVFSMSEAKDGSLWVGSYGGVTHLTGY